jgi:hypothetical protein
MTDLVAGSPYDSGDTADVTCPCCAGGRHTVALSTGMHNFTYCCGGKHLTGGCSFGTPDHAHRWTAAMIEDTRASKMPPIEPDFRARVERMKGTILAVVKAEVTACREATGLTPADIRIHITPVASNGPAAAWVPSDVTIRFDF